MYFVIVTDISLYPPGIPKIVAGPLPYAAAAAERDRRSEAEGRSTDGPIRYRFGLVEGPTVST